MITLKQIRSALFDIRNYKLSREQKRAIFHTCPNCELGHLHAVGDNDDSERYLWCNNCDLSMDSSGGYIA